MSTSKPGAIKAAVAASSSQPHPEEVDATGKRVVLINDRASNRKLSPRCYKNDIQTSKYTWWNFLPKSLILQFLYAANLYFLISTIIQCIKIISPLDPFTAIFPFILVILVSLFREAVEDYKRHKNDYLVNEKITNVFDNQTQSFMPVQQKDIQIGDIIRVTCEKEIPADMILVLTNEENGNGYVETANLDGEQNLKCKSANEAFKKYEKEIPLSELKGKLICDLPNNNIHFFKGILYLNSSSTPIMLSNSNVMLRGTKLKNTDWVIGFVVYTGKETKIIKNQGVVRHKLTHIEKLQNKIICITLFIQTVLCFTLALLSAEFQDSTYPQHWYLYGIDSEDIYSPALQGLLNYFTYFLLLNTLIPISLIISLEAVKQFQSNLMEYDMHMGYPLSEDGPAQSMKVLNTHIHEELGKIEYIFTDKTGTLTSNKMVFRNAYIAGIDYCEPELVDILQNIDFSKQKQIEDYYMQFYNFWLCASICHDVLLEKKEKKTENQEDLERTNASTNEISYHGSSPDEVCLVGAASRFNFKFLNRTTNSISIKIGNENVNYKLLRSIEFNSDRKRMSVFVQDLKTDKIYIYTKGADSFMMENLSAESEKLKPSFKKILKVYSKQGLRTLCLGRKEINSKTYFEWEERFEKLQMRMISDPNPDSIAFLISKMENEIESGITLVGVSALEDKLQDGVPEVIKEIHEAGINMWMLTGDKLETAENIGYLCNLLSNNTKVFRVHTSDRETSRIKEILNINDEGNLKAKSSLNSQKEQMHQSVGSAKSVSGTNSVAAIGGAPEQQSQKPRRLSKRLMMYRTSSIERKCTIDFVTQQLSLNAASQNQNGAKPYSGFALVIEGDAIEYALTDEKCTEEFLAIIQHCSTVICCRSTPTQKARVVNFVKYHFQKTCLAIGDGGNDVTMIQEADVGIGIIGKEGNQAALNSDYYFGQFRFLGRLLFVHGRWNLFRTSYFMNYFYLKNAIFTLQQFIFAFYCGKSGVSFWEDGYLLNFNSIITACAPVYYAAFEQDVNPHNSEHIAKNLPLLYKEFRYKDLFSFKTFIKQMVWGAVLASAIFYSVQMSIDNGIIEEEGKIDGLWFQSMVQFFCTVGVVWGINFMDTKLFNLFTLFTYLPLSVLLYFPTFAFTWDMFAGPMQHLLISFIWNFKFWLISFLVIGTVCVAKYAYRSYQYIIAPELVHKLELQRNNVITSDSQEALNENNNNNNNSFHFKLDQSSTMFANTPTQGNFKSQEKTATTNPDGPNEGGFRSKTKQTMKPNSNQLAIIPEAKSELNFNDDSRINSNEPSNQASRELSRDMDDTSNQKGRRIDRIQITNCPDTPPNNCSPFNFANLRADKAATYQVQTPHDVTLMLTKDRSNYEMDQLMLNPSPSAFNSSVPDDSALLKTGNRENDQRSGGGIVRIDILPPEIEKILKELNVALKPVQNGLIQSAGNHFSSDYHNNNRNVDSQYGQRTDGKNVFDSRLGKQIQLDVDMQEPDEEMGIRTFDKSNLAKYQK